MTTTLHVKYRQDCYKLVKSQSLTFTFWLWSVKGLAFLLYLVSLNKCDKSLLKSSYVWECTEYVKRRHTSNACSSIFVLIVKPQITVLSLKASWCNPIYALGTTFVMIYFEISFILCMDKKQTNTNINCTHKFWSL